MTAQILSMPLWLRCLLIAGVVVAALVRAAFVKGGPVIEAARADLGTDDLMDLADAVQQDGMSWITPLLREQADLELWEIENGWVTR